MFDHIGIKVNDVSASKDFYTLLLAPLDYRCIVSLRPEKESFAFYNHDSGSPLKSACDETHQSGPLHIAFTASNRAQVNAFYAAGLNVGGTCNGKPGVRVEYHRWYYGVDL